MAVQYKDFADISDSIGLLISILLCYPAICSVKYLPDDYAMRFTVLLKKPLTDSEFEALAEKLSLSIEVLGQLNRSPVEKCELHKAVYNDTTVLEIDCGMDDLTREMIALINEIVLNEFVDSVIVENKEVMYEEDIQFQEMIIDNMLESVRSSAPYKSLIGYREEGKVMVFNK